jgi:hypothetical protein
LTVCPDGPPSGSSDHEPALAASWARENDGPRARRSDASESYAWRAPCGALCRRVGGPERGGRANSCPGWGQAVGTPEVPVFALRQRSPSGIPPGVVVPREKIIALDRAIPELDGDALEWLIIDRAIDHLQGDSVG